MRKFAWLALAAAALVAAPAWSQSGHGNGPAKPEAPAAVAPPSGVAVPGGAMPGLPPGHPPIRMQPVQNGKPMLPLQPHGTTQPAHGTGAHGEGEGGHRSEAHSNNGPPLPMNWIYGFLGKDDKVEPSLLWRKSDMPPPFLANLINFAIFAFVIVRFGKKPLQDALVNRKKAIMQDIDAAGKMKDEASKRLQQYEDRLANIDKEIARIQQDFREQGEREKDRILKEAEEKRERMLKDAQFLIEQEAKQLRLDMMREAVETAVAEATKLLVQKVSATDHDRVAEDYLSQLAQSRGIGVSKGGSA